MAPTNLKELIEEGYATPAKLPEKNDYMLDESGSVDLSKLDSLSGYTVPLVAHDYGAKTPLMWNSLYEKLGLNIRNIMVVANPENMGVISEAFRQDPKYLGGGLGVGFKERLDYLDGLDPIDLKSANIIVNENGRLVGHNTDALGFVKSLEDAYAKVGKEIAGSNVVILGAGGVAKEVASLIAEREPHRIVILNRTFSKAVELANSLNKKYGDIAIGAGEEVIRGYLLNSSLRPDAAINLTDKGSDGPLEKYSAFAPADLKGDPYASYNENVSRTIVKNLSTLPNHKKIIIADIVLPKSGKSTTLSYAESEGLENLLDGIPMVVNQAAPAYKLVQDAHQEVHTENVSEDEALEVFRSVA